MYSIPVLFLLYGEWHGYRRQSSMVSVVIFRTSRRTINARLTFSCLLKIRSDWPDSLVGLPKSAFIQTRIWRELFELFVFWFFWPRSTRHSWRLQAAAQLIILECSSFSQLELPQLAHIRNVSTDCLTTKSVFHSIRLKSVGEKSEIRPRLSSLGHDKLRIGTVFTPHFHVTIQLWNSNSCFHCYFVTVWLAFVMSDLIINALWVFKTRTQDPKIHLEFDWIILKFVKCKISTWPRDPFGKRSVYQTVR